MIVMIMADHNEVDLRQILEANARLRYTLGAQRREGAGIIRPDRIGKDIESTRLHQHRGVTNPDGLHLSGLHVHLRLRWLHCHIFGPFRPLVRAQEPAGKHTSPAAALGHGKVLAAIRVEKALSIIMGTERPFVVDRSEEQTSELQSLMRHSYAVFCLKKKKKKH